MNEREELELIEKVKAGDRSAFRALFEEYQGRLMNYLYRIVRNRESAEEIVQETFVQAYQNIHRFDRKKAGFSTWLFTIARYRAIGELRKSGRQKSVSIETVLSEDGKLTLADVLSKEEAETEAILEKNEMTGQIDALIDSLPGPYKEVITLCVIEGLSYDEAAKIMGCARGAVAMRLARAKKQFIKMIKETKREKK